MGIIIGDIIIGIIIGDIIIIGLDIMDMGLAMFAIGLGCWALAMVSVDAPMKKASIENIILKFFIVITCECVFELSLSADSTSFEL